MAIFNNLRGLKRSLRYSLVSGMISSFNIAGTKKHPQTSDSRSHYLELIAELSDKERLQSAERTIPDLCVPISNMSSQPNLCNIFGYHIFPFMLHV